MYEGYGQGLASQMTPFQMAMMISVAANLEGRLMKPKIEMDRQPEVFSQVLDPRTGRRGAPHHEYGHRRRHRK
jgi:cell division protein FtsI/penicillin-binding protein 2